jgi:hypothetical protein
MMGDGSGSGIDDDDAVDPVEEPATDRSVTRIPLPMRKKFKG